MNAFPCKCSQVCDLLRCFSESWCLSSHIWVVVLSSSSGQSLQGRVCLEHDQSIPLYGVRGLDKWSTCINHTTGQEQWQPSSSQPAWVGRKFTSVLSFCHVSADLVLKNFSARECSKSALVLIFSAGTIFTGLLQKHLHWNSKRCRVGRFYKKNTPLKSLHHSGHYWQCTYIHDDRWLQRPDLAPKSGLRSDWWYMSKQFWRQLNLQYDQESFSEVYWYSGLQALLLAVFQTTVDFLCKNSNKNSSLQRYFGCFVSNHIVRCCDVNFSCLSQIRREKVACKQRLYIFVVLFGATVTCLDATFGQLFTLRPLMFFCFSPTLYACTCTLLKIELLSYVHG